MRNFTITEESFPDIPQLMLATYHAILKLGGSASIDEIQSQVVESEGVTEVEQLIEMKNDPRSKLNYYLAWARTYLRGKVDNSSRGVWSIHENINKTFSIDDCLEIHATVNAEERERGKIRRLERKPR